MTLFIALLYLCRGTLLVFSDVTFVVEAGVGVCGVIQTVLCEACARINGT